MQSLHPFKLSCSWNWLTKLPIYHMLYNTLSTCLISQVIYCKMWPANNHQNILRLYINSWYNANSYQVSQYSSHKVQQKHNAYKHVQQQQCTNYSTSHQYSSTQQQCTQVLTPTEKASNRAKKTPRIMLYISNGFVANYDEIKFQGPKNYKLTT